MKKLWRYINFWKKEKTQGFWVWKKDGRPEEVTQESVVKCIRTLQQSKHRVPVYGTLLEILDTKRVPKGFAKNLSVVGDRVFFDLEAEEEAMSPSREYYAGLAFSRTGVLIVGFAVEKGELK